MKVAIVGSGIAGLSAAWLLTQSGHEISLLEQLPEVGLDAHAVEFCECDFGSGGSQQVVRVDVPPRMFNRSLWPNLFRLYESVGVEITSVDPSQTFAEHGGRTSLQLGKMNRRMEQRHLSTGNSRQQIYLRQSIQRAAQYLKGKSTRRIMRDIRRMMREVPAEVNSEKIQNLDFISYLNRHKYSDEFVYQFLFPALASTVCTCSYRSLMRYPADNGVAGDVDADHG